MSGADKHYEEIKRGNVKGVAAEKKVSLRRPGGGALQAEGRAQ